MQNDPRAPDYDAQKLLLALNGYLRQIMDAEPRDPVWAPAMETRTVALVKKTLGHLDYVDIGEVECRTATCIVNVSYPANDYDKMREVSILTQWMGLSPGVGTYDSETRDGRVHEQVALIFPHDTREATAVEAWSGSARAAKLAAVKDTEVAKLVHFPTE